MIDVASFCSEIMKYIDFFTGVPDSYLNAFCNQLLLLPSYQHVIAANEGNAISIAAGHYMTTGKIPLVYMQNSGMGNALNPLASLTDENVYSIPMLLLIGWRGQPGTEDWAQHKKQGGITAPLLDLFNIKYRVLDIDNYSEILNDTFGYIQENNRTAALLVPKGIFTGEKENILDTSLPLSRRKAIEIILDTLPNDTYYIATTGRTTRELYYLRKARNEATDRDFLNVGSMGHASSVAFGMALAKPSRQFVVLDGDGAAMMHMGAMATIGRSGVNNLIHIVLNNNSHESVGGQPSGGFDVDFNAVAKACGYYTVNAAVISEKELVNALGKIQHCDRPGFMDVRIHKGMDVSLPALSIAPKDIIRPFMEELGNG